VGLQFILVLCLASVFCLAPLSVYLLWIARITRRKRPLVVAGDWDFVGLICGLSGFILFGGGLVLSLLQTNFRYWMRGNFDGLRRAWQQEYVTWILLASAYLVFVSGLTTLTLQSRRRSLVIYNIEPAAFEAMLAEVFEHLNVTVERRGDVWYASGPLFELDRFARGRTVTLRWLSDDRQLFQSVDRLLREAVRSHFSDENPATDWIFAAAVGAGAAAVLFFGLLVYVLRPFPH
jgi:hypothetical protein